MTAGWVWLIIGGVLMIAEMIAPGFFLLWIGAAAAVTGLVTLALGIGQAAQLLLFAVVAGIAVLAARHFRVGQAIASDDPLLNDRGARMVGRVVTAVEPISADDGRVKVGDSVWTARGDAASPGDQVRVIAVEGNVLRVARD